MHSKDMKRVPEHWRAKGSGRQQCCVIIRAGRNESSKYKDFPKGTISKFN